jgi:hypothetical protein
MRGKIAGYVLRDAPSALLRTRNEQKKNGRK